MASSPLNNLGGGGDLMNFSRIFFGHVNFSEMNEGIHVYGRTKLNNYKEGDFYHNNTLQK